MEKSRGSVMEAVAGMLKPGMMRQRLKRSKVQKRVVIMGT